MMLECYIFYIDRAIYILNLIDLFSDRANNKNSLELLFCVIKFANELQ